MIKGNFIDNLPKVYGIYTGGFIVFIIMMAILEQMGVCAKSNWYLHSLLSLSVSMH
jgi:cation/acetate symporter